MGCRTRLDMGRRASDPLSTGLRPRLDPGFPWSQPNRAYPGAVPIEPRPNPQQTPPQGVPRWLWPPPGASVRAVVIREVVDEGGGLTHAVEEGEAPGPKHLRALHWLLDEHTRAELPPEGCPFEGQVRLEIATTPMPGGRVGHAYALNGGPLGAPSGDGARGILWRYIDATVGL